MKARKRYAKILSILWKNPALLHLLFDDEEWKQYEAKQEIPAETSAEMRDHILSAINNKMEMQERKGQFRLRMLNTARYAAAAILFFTMGWLGYTTFVPQHPVHDQKKSRLATTPSTGNAVALWEVLENIGKEKRIFVLPDSSRITIYPSGQLKFRRGLEGPVRDVFLTGKAYFKVKRNVHRPFSVYAGGLKTTALGTSFTINTTAGKTKTSVRLHSGKIVVRAEAVQSNMEPVYINQPSAALVFDRSTQRASLSDPKPVVKPVAATFLEQKGSLITMRNIPLSRVISLLNEAYHVNITANKKDIGNITYTGEVDTNTEDIEHVLQVICLINNLEIEVQDNQHYTIQKIK